MSHPESESKNFHRLRLRLRLHLTSDSGSKPPTQATSYIRLRFRLKVKTTDSGRLWLRNPGVNLAKVYLPTVYLGLSLRFWWRLDRNDENSDILRKSRTFELDFRSKNVRIALQRVYSRVCDDILIHLCTLVFSARNSMIILSFNLHPV